MEGVTGQSPLLHAVRVSRRAALNRAFAAVYTCAILSLLYHHLLTALYFTSLLSFSISLLLFISDGVLGFMWSTTQAFRMRPVHRRIFPENLEKVMEEKDFPAMDMFICTADPYKEPPMRVANTALSVMAYDYPAEKLSVYVSDDGGSELTLFAFMEAARFGKEWLPFCRKKKIVERCPDAYFRSNPPLCSDTEKIKIMYESMKSRVENVVERGKVGEEYITSQQQLEAFNKWAEGFTPQDHPAIIQVLLEKDRDRDISGKAMPNLVYVSRQKSRLFPHHFKGGALNVLLRVSAVMTNAPIILTLDCDNYSNDPRTPRRVLCYFCDPHVRPKLGYVQFPQRFHGINKNDIYACEFKRMYKLNPEGMDGFSGPDYFGSGTFFFRRALFGGPSSTVALEIPELLPDHVVEKPIQAQPILKLAHIVASSDYENQTNWGSKLGFRYGSLVEDYYTGFRMHCEGWKSVLCYPDRPAFLGDIPITLNDVLTQTKRWTVGLLEVGFSKYSPLTFGIRGLGPIMGLCYAHYAFGAFWSIPIATYAFLPQLALLNEVSIFPKAPDTWFFVYVFLFLGAYGQDCLDFVLAQGTFKRWWSDQRMWMVRGLTCYLFGSIEYINKLLGIFTRGFDVTNKVVDDEQSRMYREGRFDFGVDSPMFVPLGVAAITNLISFVGGSIRAFEGKSIDGMLVQMFIAGFVVLNCWPIYEAMVVRRDAGRLPTKSTITSLFLSWALYKLAASLSLKT